MAVNLTAQDENILLFGDKKQNVGLNAMWQTKLQQPATAHHLANTVPTKKMLMVAAKPIGLRKP